jgi:hypothetical protein
MHIAEATSSPVTFDVLCKGPEGKSGFVKHTGGEGGDLPSSHSLYEIIDHSVTGEGIYYIARWGEQH